MARNERVQAISRLLYRPNTQWRTCWERDKVLAPMVKRIASHVTVADADFRGGKALGVKKAQNWKYPGGVIQRHSDLIINGTEYFDPKELPDKKPRRKQESNLFITINTNRAPKNHPADSERAYSAMEDTLRVMADEANICAMLTFGPKDSTYVGDKYADVIDRVEWKAGIETGEVLERLHCHIWMTVHHYSQIQINRQLTQSIFRREYNKRAPESMQVKGMPYVAVKLLPQSDFMTIMKQYMHKGLTDSDSQVSTFPTTE
jgi:hypothetical protein